MKAIQRVYIILFSAIMILTAIPFSASAMLGVDEIENYVITVDLRNDASADIKYHIDWKVLADSNEGDLTWVDIGIPNSHVDNIKALSSNIASIEYNGSNGSYVRIYFKDSYGKGDVFAFDFSIHQDYLYNADSSYINYTFTPGWFNEIEVKSVTINWNSKNVIRSECINLEAINNSNVSTSAESKNTISEISTTSEKSTVNDDSAVSEKSSVNNEKNKYLIWKGSMLPQRTVTVKIKYKISSFNIKNKTDNINESIWVNNYPVKSNNSGSPLIILFPIFLTIGISIFISRMRGGYGGRYRGGFWGGGFHGGGFHGGGGGCACACVSCACACACAGGGRAGCSAKKFYGAEVNTEKLIDSLNNKVKDK